MGWQGQGKPEINIRVGLHAADVFVGNLGSKMRMKYGVLGDGVNLASRLEELNKRYSTEVLISDDVLKQEGMKEQWVIRPVDLVVVKGRVTPTPIYEVLGSRSTANENTLQISAKAELAMQSYLNREFNKAIECLQEVQRLKGSVDVAGDVLLNRCRKFAVKPLPADWDGSEVLHEKTF